MLPLRRARMGRINRMSQHIKPRKILVVDDDPIIRDMMIDILSLEGYDIETARHGLEAEPQLRKRHVIVLMSAVDKLVEVSSLVNADATMPKPFFVDDVVSIVEPYMG